jgi:hypothetical protein
MEFRKLVDDVERRCCTVSGAELEYLKGTDADDRKKTRELFPLERTNEAE